VNAGREGRHARRRQVRFPGPERAEAALADRRSRNSAARGGTEAVVSRELRATGEKLFPYYRRDQVTGRAVAAVADIRLDGGCASLTRAARPRRGQVGASPYKQGTARSRRERSERGRQALSILVRRATRPSRESSTMSVPWHLRRRSARPGWRSITWSVGRRTVLPSARRRRHVDARVCGQDRLRPSDGVRVGTEGPGRFAEARPAGANHVRCRPVTPSA